MTPQEMQSSLEAIIYAADEPATLDQIAGALGVEKTEARAALDLLVAAYQTDDRGVEVRKVAGGWKFYTKPQHHDVVRKFIKSLQPPLRLTMPALETLAVVAYKQPVTVPEINEIRGVNVGGVIKTLLEKRLITTAGRKEVIGRPILYRTSKQFMMRFGLSDLDELPSLKEFEQLAQAALGSDEGILPVDPGSAAESAANDTQTPVEGVQLESVDVNAEDALASETPPPVGETGAAESVDVDANDALVAEGGHTTAEILASGDNNDLAELGEESAEESGSSRGAAAGN
ncbi:MAG TPA: SMC-Scp complex subunit ScpB [Candidatus Acidoferrum sp.]|nr:SMC-Scp complex subunit ScpB [Candidatus Acidoferrum sp.]